MAKCEDDVVWVVYGMVGFGIHFSQANQSDGKMGGGLKEWGSLNLDAEENYQMAG